MLYSPTTKVRGFRANSWGKASIHDRYTLFEQRPSAVLALFCHPENYFLFKFWIGYCVLMVK